MIPFHPLGISWSSPPIHAVASNLPTKTLVARQYGKQTHTHTHQEYNIIERKRVSNAIIIVEHVQ